MSVKGKMIEEQDINQLPESWTWTTIGDVAILSSGGTPDRGTHSYFNGNIPWVKSGELNYNTILNTEERITKNALDSSNAKMVPAGTLLVAMYGSTVGKLAFLGVPAATNQAIASLITTGSFEKKYLYYYLIYSREKLLRKRIGGAQPNISQKILQNFRIPLAPFQTQELIVAQIDSLFTKLDEAESTLRKAKKELDVYNLALSKYAFEGKLTEKWRNEYNPKSADEILSHLQDEKINFFEKKDAEWKELIALWEKQGKTEKKPIKLKSPTAFAYNEKDEFRNLVQLPVKWKWIHWNEILDYREEAFKRGPFGSSLTKAMFKKNGFKVYEQYCPINDDCSYERYFITPEKFEELKSFEVRSGDYLISCSGISLGRITEVPKHFKEGIINQALLRVRINKAYINNKFFILFFRSPYFQKQIFSNSKGSAIPNIKGVNELKIIPLPFLSIDEQNKIVEILESRFTLVNNLHSTVDRTINNIVALRHSILKKAFEGKLVDAISYESAKELLEIIKTEKNSYFIAQKKAGTSKVKKTNNMDKKQSILSILKESKTPITAQELWESSSCEGDIERFYNEIKIIYDEITEIKLETESLLSIKNEN